TCRTRTCCTWRSASCCSARAPRCPAPGSGAGEVPALELSGAWSGPERVGATHDDGEQEADHHQGEHGDRETGVALLAGVVLVRPRGLVELVVQLRAVLLHRGPPGGQGRRPATTSTSARGHAPVRRLTTG